MARDHDHARLILKQGNVTSININNDFNSEYNLLGFHNSRSVFEYTERMNTEDKSSTKQDVDTIIPTNKQIIIKPISDSSGIVLINDKNNIKIPLKKCTDVPKNILKMFNEKKNIAHVNVKNQHLTLNKTPRTYEKRKDKTPYLNPNTDKNVKVNIDFKETSTLKANAAACANSSGDPDKNKSGIRMVDINKLTANKLINGAPHKVSIDKVNQLLKGTASKNFIVLKCPLERRKTIDSAELDTLNDQDSKTKPVNKYVCVKTYARSKLLVDKGESPQKPSPCISDSNNTEIINIDDEDIVIKPATPDNIAKCIKNKGDDNVRVTIELDTVNKQPETREIVTDMGKIKHFKEKSSSSELNQMPVANVSRNDIIYSNERVGGGIVPENVSVKKNNVEDVRVQNRKRIQRAKILNKRYIKQEIDKYFKASITNRKKRSNNQQKTLKDTQSQTDIKILCNNWTQTEIPPEEPHFVSVSSILPTTIFSGNNNNNSNSNTPNIIEESFRELDDDGVYKRNVLFTDVNFGSGPKIELYEKSGEALTYRTGNNLDNLVANVNIPPSHLVSANAMGYLTSENVHATTKNDGVQAKKAFQDYLRNCCQQDSAGNLPLHIEVMKNDLTEVRKQALMINLWKLSIDTTNSNHLTPLHLAVIHNCDQSIVTFLLDRGADLGCTDSEGNNAMHLAVFHNAKTILRILLQRATDNNFSLNTFNYEGFTPLLLATIEDKLDMVKTFLDFGVDANVRDQKSGRTPLFHALENNNFDMVQHLLCCGADKKIKNFSGTSAHDAVFELEGISADIKNMIIGKELFTVNSTRAEKRKKGGSTGGDKPSKEVCTKRLKTVKTYRKINLLE